MRNLMVLAGAALLLGACTTSQVVRRPDGTVEYQIACGAATGWNICYDRANELCPTGYTTLSQEGGFNRKELRVACPGQRQTTQG